MYAILQKFKVLWFGMLSSFLDAVVQSSQANGMARLTILDAVFHFLEAKERVEGLGDMCLFVCLFVEFFFRSNLFVCPLCHVKGTSCSFLMKIPYLKPVLVVRRRCSVCSL